MGLWDDVLKSWFPSVYEDRNRPTPVVLPRKQYQSDRVPGRAVAPVNNSAMPSMADILTRLQSLQDPSRYLSDPDSLDRQARATASMQFDPVISQLRNQMGSAQNRGARNKQELGRMFSTLSSDLQGDIPEITQDFAGAKQRTQSEYDQLKSMVNQQYANSQGEQEALLKRLNIEAAAPEVFDQQFKDRDYFQNLANKEGQTAQTSLGMEERGATEFTRRGSEIARTEGTQRQADLMSQLEELLSQYESEIGAQQIAKEQAYQSNLGQLSTQARNDATSQAQRDFDNYIKSIQLGRSLRSDELERPEATTVKSISDVPARALDLGVGQGGAQKIQNVFMNTVLNDPTILAGIDQNYGTALTKETLAARILEAGRNEGLNQQELNALQVAALEYFGRR